MKATKTIRHRKRNVTSMREGRVATAVNKVRKFLEKHPEASLLLELQQSPAKRTSSPSENHTPPPKRTRRTRKATSLLFDAEPTSTDTTTEDFEVTGATDVIDLDTWPDTTSHPIHAPTGPALPIARPLTPLPFLTTPTTLPVAAFYPSSPRTESKLPSFPVAQQPDTPVPPTISTLLTPTPIHSFRQAYFCETTPPAHVVSSSLATPSLLSPATFMLNQLGLAIQNEKSHPELLERQALHYLAAKTSAVDKSAEFVRVPVARLLTRDWKIHNLPKETKEIVFSNFATYSEWLVKIHQMKIS